jgi:hypothetical protein
MGNKRGRGGNPNQEFKHPYVVRDDATPGDEANGGNSEKNYDVLSLIAEEWLRLNPNATSIGKGDRAPKMNLAGLSKAKKRKIIEDWIDTENKLVDVNGILCDDKTKKFRSPLIWPGLKLDLPMVAGTNTLVEEGAATDGATVKVVTPPQAGPCGKAKKCVEKPADAPVADNLDQNLVLAPKVDLVQPKDVNPIYFGMRAQAATNPKYWQPGSIDWAYELKGSTNYNQEFTKKYYSEQVAPRIPETGERRTGDTDDFMLSGKNKRRRNRDSREDNDEAKRDDANGTRHGIFRRITGDRGHIRVNGFIDKFADGVNDKVKDENGNLVVVPKGSMIRHDDGEWSTFGGQSRGITTNLPLGVGKFHLSFLPGYSITTSNPSKQTSWSTVTGPGGLTEVAHAFSDLNKIGKIGVFTDEQTVNSNTVVDARHVVAGTFLDLTTQTVNKNFDIVASTTADAAAKEAAATEVLKALRDQKENFLLKQNGAYMVKLQATEDAVRSYFTQNSITVPSQEEINDLGKHPRLPLRYMDKEALSKQHNNKFNKDKFAYIRGHEGEVHPLNEQAQDMVYGLVQNKYELRVAQANDKVKTQPEMLNLNKDAWEKILASDESIKEYGKFVASDQQAAIAAGAWLSDIDRNPKNYFQFQTVEHTVDGEGKTSLTKMSGGEARRAANSAVTTLLGSDKASIRDVTIRGHSSPMLFFRDQPYAMARPEQFGPDLGEAIQKNPEAFRQMMRRSIAIDEGKTDGNRHAIGMLASYARVNGVGKDNEPVAAAEALKATMSAENAQVVDDAIFHSFHYGDTHVRNAPTQGQERVQNIFAKAQNEHQAYLANVKNGVKDAKDVDMGTLYNDLFLSDAAKDAGSQQIGTLGGFGVAKALGKDAIFLTLMRDPKAFDAVKSHLGKENDDLKDHAKSNYRALNIRDRNNQLRRVIGRVQDIAEEYNKSEPKDQALWQKAVDEYNSFFVTMEVKGDRKHNRHAQRVSKNMANAVDGLYYAVGQNPDVSATVMKTMLDDPRLSNAALSVTAAGASATDVVDHSHLNTQMKDNTSKLNGAGYIGATGAVYGYQGRGETVYTSMPVKVKHDGTTKVKRSGEKAPVSFDPAISFDAELANLKGLLADGNADAATLNAQLGQVKLLLGSREAVGRMGNDAKADKAARAAFANTLGDAIDQLSRDGSIDADTRSALVADAGKATAKPLQGGATQISPTATPLATQLGTLKALLGSASPANPQQLSAAIDGVKLALMGADSGTQYLSDNSYAMINSAVNAAMDEVKGSDDHVLTAETQAQLTKAINGANAQLQAAAVGQQTSILSGSVDGKTRTQIAASVNMSQTGKLLGTQQPVILAPGTKALVDAAKTPDAKHQVLVDALAASLQQQVKAGTLTLPVDAKGQQLTAQQVAAVMLDPQNPLVDTKHDGQQLGFAPISSGLLGSLVTGANTGLGRGLIAKWMLALPFIRGTQTITNIIYVEEGCPTCWEPLNGGGEMRAAGQAIEGIFNTTGGTPIVTGELAPSVGKAMNLGKNVITK